MQHPHNVQIGTIRINVEIVRAVIEATEAE
jgi:hypothetical protein